MHISPKVVEVEPNTDQWLALRRGRITASRMGDVLAGKNTKRYRDYQQELALELLGHEEEELCAPWYQHGKAMEPYAFGAYQWKFDIELTNKVFFIHGKYDWLSCSPDGVRVETLDDPVEIKCREKLKTYLTVVGNITRTGKIESTYRPQVQAQMFVMGVPSIKFINYYHDAEQQIRKLHVHTVSRDEAMIERIETRCLEFMIEAYKLANKNPERLAA